MVTLGREAAEVAYDQMMINEGHIKSLIQTGAEKELPRAMKPVELVATKKANGICQHQTWLW